MRVTLDETDAERVRSALLCLHGGAEIDRLAGLFTPVERVTAEVREHVYPFVLTYKGQPTADAFYETRESAEAAIGGYHHYDVATIDPPKRQTLLTCPDCGSTTFRVDEDYGTTRTMAGNEADGEGGVLAFNGDFEWYEGDNDPGEICDGCEAPIDLPEGWEIDYR
jgi:hypothetical protein